MFVLYVACGFGCGTSGGGVAGYCSLPGGPTSCLSASHMVSVSGVNSVVAVLVVFVGSFDLV